ncbi:MAG TPA: 4Fe-4S dicluster domain-containing protein [Chloroflexia bacterium]|nr:4Fe-4S dicluster domain-containing protein [Chloroflexia bacterium]
MLNDLINNGIPGFILLVVAAGLLLYALAAIWTHVAAGRLLWQNLFRSNQVNLPSLGHEQAVPASGSDSGESTALVLSRTPMPLNPDQLAPRDFSNIIYPVAGRNGIHFAPERCTSCGLCTYSCPTAAITTPEQEKGYLRVFDLRKCVYCGLCESACPTSAIRLTLNAEPVQNQAETLTVQGEVETEACQVCKQKIPRTDLLAERIYAITDPAWEDQEPDEDELTRRTQAINPNGICLECQKRVIEAEDVICG